MFFSKNYDRSLKKSSQNPITTPEKNDSVHNMEISIFMFLDIKKAIQVFEGYNLDYLSWPINQHRDQYMKQMRASYLSMLDLLFHGENFTTYTVNFADFVENRLFEMENGHLILPFICGGLDNEYGAIAAHLALKFKKKDCLEFLINNGCQRIANLDEALKTLLKESGGLDPNGAEFEMCGNILSLVRPFINGKTEYQHVLQFAVTDGHLSLLCCFLAHPTEGAGIPPYESIIKDVQNRHGQDIAQQLIDAFPSLVSVSQVVDDDPSLVTEVARLTL